MTRFLLEIKSTCSVFTNLLSLRGRGNFLKSPSSSSVTGSVPVLCDARCPLLVAVTDAIEDLPVKQRMNVTLTQFESLDRNIVIDIMGHKLSHKV